MSYADYIGNVRLWVMNHITLIGEPDELLIAPQLAIETISVRGLLFADCDDAAMLVGALAAVVGLPVRYRAVHPREDGSFGHVFAEAELAMSGGNLWLPTDPTVRTFPAWTGESMVETV